MDASDPRYPVVRELVAYWLKRPQAADTLGGICKWWLSGSSVSADLVDDALAWLVGQGVVVARVAADGRVRYHFSDQSKTGPC